MQSFKPFNPFNRSPLDFLDTALTTCDGNTATVTQSISGFFIIRKNGVTILKTRDIVNVCYLLNDMEARI